MVVKFDVLFSNSEMWIDLGQISEDVIGNSTLNTEDGITKESPIPNNIIDLGEDVGYDAISDQDEKNSSIPGISYPYPLNQEKILLEIIITLISRLTGSFKPIRCLGFIIILKIMQLLQNLDNFLIEKFLIIIMAKR